MTNVVGPVFDLIRPTARPVPIVVSVPHCGTGLPPEIAARLVETKLPDTDWFVDELYEFAPRLGITLIRARFSRYVIDLNRDPAGAKLYADGRQETELVPTRSFAGAALYRGAKPDDAEIAKRRQLYYDPYHAEVKAQLEGLRSTFPHVLLWEAHSILRHVPTIRKEPFPDLMLGDRKGETAAAALSAAALGALRRGERWTVAQNDPFMGGYLTRTFGRPATGTHAIQLEMSQDIYMDAVNAQRAPAKMKPVQTLLEETLAAVAAALARLP
jgi:N-formylglutamate deformylase